MTAKTAFIVIDTNVLISAGLLPNSKSARVLSLAVAHYVIAQNKFTWHELETRIARPKFDRYFGQDGRLRHMVKIAQLSQFFDPVHTVAVSQDASDDMFIALALDAKANIVISGDPDLKNVKTYQGIDIVSPATFFDRVNPR